MKKIYLYAVSFLVLLVILYEIWPLPFEYTAKTVLLPAVNVLSTIGQKALSPIKLLKNVSALDQLNKSLEEQNNLLITQLTKAEDTSKSCSLLAQEIEKDKGYVNSLPAKVIGRTPGGLNSTLLLNKGLGDGIAQGDAVLTNGYFVGKIKNVESSKSEVALIFSHSSMIPVMMASNREGGLLQGGLEGLTVTDIPISSKATTDDSILTSGLGGDLPSGLLIGKIGVHLGMEGDLFQKVQVTSPVNPYEISYVTILSK